MFFNIGPWKLQSHRGLKNGSRRGASVSSIGPGQRHISPTEHLTARRIDFMDEEMLLDLHDISRAYLRTENVPYDRQKALVEVLPDVFLFQVGIHPRKR